VDRPKSRIRVGDGGSGTAVVLRLSKNTTPDDERWINAAACFSRCRYTKPSVALVGVAAFFLVIGIEADRLAQVRKGQQGRVGVPAAAISLNAPCIACIAAAISVSG
jgi:hypothetical protein